MYVCSLNSNRKVSYKYFLHFGQIFDILLSQIARTGRSLSLLTRSVAIASFALELAIASREHWCWGLSSRVLSWATGCHASIILTVLMVLLLIPTVLVPTDMDSIDLPSQQMSLASAPVPWQWLFRRHNRHNYAAWAATSLCFANHSCCILVLLLEWGRVTGTIFHSVFSVWEQIEIIYKGHWLWFIC